MSEDTDKFLDDLNCLIEAALKLTKHIKSSESYIEMTDLHNHLQDKVTQFYVRWGPNNDESAK